MRLKPQEDLWVATSELPRTAGHPFYERLNGLFNEHGFDDFVEGLCAKFYADKMGRPSLAPGVYFRLLLVGYFEGIGSERRIAWRASDSLGLREFLGLKVSESPSDHSTISRTRRLIDVAIHEAVFDWVLKRIGASGLLRGKTIGIDATTLEATLARRPAGAGSGVCESAAHPGRARAAAAAATRRAAGATLCASVRERRDETAACTGT